MDLKKQKQMQMQSCTYSAEGAYACPAKKIVSQEGRHPRPSAIARRPPADVVETFVAFAQPIESPQTYQAGALAAAETEQKSSSDARALAAFAVEKASAASEGAYRAATAQANAWTVVKTKQTATVNGHASSLSSTMSGEATWVRQQQANANKFYADNAGAL